MPGHDGFLPSPVQLIRSAALCDITEYACAATVPKEARLVFLAGAFPLAADGTTVVAGDPAGQAAACIDNLELALAAAGAALADVISTRILVASSRQADLVARGSPSVMRSVTTTSPARCWA